MTDKKKSAHRKITVPEAKRIVEELTLFNNELMSKVFDKNPEATELLLRIILEREDIKVLSVIGQDESGSHVRRARFYGSMISSSKENPSIM